MRIKNKVALITGGASGIGRETDILLGKEGARLVVADSNYEQGRCSCVSL